MASQSRTRPRTGSAVGLNVYIKEKLGTPEYSKLLRPSATTQISTALGPLYGEIASKKLFEDVPLSSAENTPEKQKPPKQGGAKKHTYKNKEYTVQTGARGGKYIVANGKKVYV